MLVKRILTALIGIPLAIVVINYGQWAFAVAVILLSLVGWHEYSRMLKKRDIRIAFWWGSLIILLLMGCSWVGNTTEYMAVLAMAVIWLMALTFICHKSFSFYEAAFSLLGILYVGVMFSHLIFLRFTDASINLHTAVGVLSQGAAYLWIPFLGTWASDTFAYFTGRVAGRTKLCPTISPNKTVEGALGGAIGCILVVYAAGSLFMLPVYHRLIIGMLVAITAPAGDLAESMLKRFSGIKDSGNILPGHGGILDRFDSILFVIPVIYYYVQFFVIN